MLVLPLKLKLDSQQVWIQRLWLAVSEARLRGKSNKETGGRRRRARICWIRPETLSESQKFSLYKDLEGYRIFWDTSMSLQKTSSKTNVFEAFPRLHPAKGPNRERQVLSSDKEIVEQPPSSFTHNWPRIRPGFRKFATLHLLRDGLVTHAVIRATTVFNLQCNNVARQVEGKCCPCYWTLKLSSNISLDKNNRSGGRSVKQILISSRSELIF